tara:strand:+ start:11131 stop:11298 length:168 start_codon:yes stop_codon:yes gene_type:complete
MFWPNELSALIISALSITSDESKALTVWLVVCGYGFSFVLISLAVSLSIFKTKKD